MILQPFGCRHLFRLDRKVVLPPAARWQNFGQGLIDLVEAWAWGRGQTCRLILNAWQPPQKGLIGTYFGTQKFDKNEWLTVTKSHYRLFLDSWWTHTHIYMYIYVCTICIDVKLHCDAGARGTHVLPHAMKLWTWVGRETWPVSCTCCFIHTYIHIYIYSTTPGCI